MSKYISSIISMSKLNDFFQAIGIIGLIASLIFVGLELKQNQKIALAKTQQERNNTIRLQIMNFTSAGLDWQSNAIENKTNYEFSLKETARRNAYHEAWFLYENDFFQYEQGLVSEEVWQAKLSAFSYWYNMCEMRSLYEIRSKWMPAAFRELIASFPDEC